MAKANPLFIDSTKMTGDSIGTQIELARVALYEDESLFVLVTNHAGVVIETAMKLNEEMNYQARVWLGHQRSFTYQFVIMKNEKRFLESVPQKARAQYAILDNWLPVLAQSSEPIVAPADSTSEEPVEGQNIATQMKSVANIMEKFVF